MTEEDGYLSISTLNDFIFCPYSIYLHNVYSSTEEEVYHASPQVLGIDAHTSIDTHTYNAQKGDITSLFVCSNEFGLMGKIDVYKQDTKILIERKRELKKIYQGQIYQLYAQYFCMKEMGYDIVGLALYSMVDNKTHVIDIPTTEQTEEFRLFLKKIRQYNLTDPIDININKCQRCVYCNLCDKINIENVYS